MTLPTLPAPLAARFVLEGVLGRGAMGVVLAARDLTLGRPVALKLVLAAARDDDGLARFRREARVLAQLSHPGVVRLFDAEVADGTPYLVMERLEGQALDAATSKERKTAGQVLALLDALLDALAYVHERDILHRDIKPSNVFLRDDGSPVLIDFGLVRGAGNTVLTRAGDIVGTPRFLAPELIVGGEHTAASDLFALSMLGVEVLTGADLHETQGVKDSLARLLSSLSSGAYLATAAPVLSPYGRLGDVLLRGIAPDAQDRFENASAMRAALAPPAAVRSARLARPARPARSEGVARGSPPVPLPERPARGGLALALVVALAIGTSAVTIRSRAPSPGPAPATSAPGELLEREALACARAIDALDRQAGPPAAAALAEQISTARRTFVPLLNRRDTPLETLREIVNAIHQLRYMTFIFPAAAPAGFDPRALLTGEFEIGQGLDAIAGMVVAGACQFYGWSAEYRRARRSTLPMAIRPVENGARYDRALLELELSLREGELARITLRPDGASSRGWLMVALPADGLSRGPHDPWPVYHFGLDPRIVEQAGKPATLTVELRTRTGKPPVQHRVADCAGLFARVASAAPSTGAAPVTTADLVGSWVYWHTDGRIAGDFELAPGPGGRLSGRHLDRHDVPEAAVARLSLGGGPPGPVYLERFDPRYPLPGFQAWYGRADRDERARLRITGYMLTRDGACWSRSFVAVRDARATPPPSRAHNQPGEPFRETFPGDTLQLCGLYPDHEAGRAAGWCTADQGAQLNHTVPAGPGLLRVRYALAGSRPQVRRLYIGPTALESDDPLDDVVTQAPQVTTVTFAPTGGRDRIGTLDVPFTARGEETRFRLDSAGAAPGTVEDLHIHAFELRAR